jgi:hypothetical protein
MKECRSRYPYTNEQYATINRRLRLAGEAWNQWQGNRHFRCRTQHPPVCATENSRVYSIGVSTAVSA